ncbi:hypothetical protein [Streptomyces sp. NPDC059003]|uniref:hypothetical protein n=1 Tax=Streptomyces sp. NPDC059003 TaxID=3346691 RepID=UPI0036CF6054
MGVGVGVGVGVQVGFGGTVGSGGFVGVGLGGVGDGEQSPPSAVAVARPAEKDAQASAGTAVESVGAAASRASVMSAKARVTGAYQPLEDAGTTQIMEAYATRAREIGSAIVRRWERTHAGSRDPAGASAARPGAPGRSAPPGPYGTLILHARPASRPARPPARRPVLHARPASRPAPRPAGPPDGAP